MRERAEALSTNQQIALLLGLITLLGLALRIPSMNDALLWDELSTHYVVIDRSFGGMLDMVRGEQEVSPPLYFVFAWLFAQLGDPSLTLRLPSLVAGLATIPLTYLLGAWTVGRKAGLFGALLIAVSPFMVFYSAEARPYGMVTCLTLLSTLFLIAAVRENRTRWWVGFAVFSAASMYTHYTALFVLSVQFVWVLFYFKGLRIRALLAAAGSAVLFLPWLPEYFADSNSPWRLVIEILQPFTAASVRSDLSQWALVHPMVARAELPGRAWQLLLVAGLAMAAGGLLRELWLRRNEPFFWRPNRWVVLVVTLALAAPVIAAIVSYVDVSVFLPRNLATSWPGLAVSTGALVMASRVRLLRIASTGLIVSLLRLHIRLDVRRQLPASRLQERHHVRRRGVPARRPHCRIRIPQPAPISPLDVPLDELRESQPDIAEVDRLGIVARELSDAAIQPGGVGRYAPLPIEAPEALAQRTGNLSGSEKLFVVTPGGDPLELVAVFEDMPLALYLDALPEGVELLEVETFPGFAGTISSRFTGKVSVMVFRKEP